MPMEEFDLASFEISNTSKEEPSENLWMCSASKASMAIDGSEWCKDAMEDAFISIPYL